MEIKNVVVIGGGVLGSQIAYQAAYCGFDVTIWLKYFKHIYNIISKKYVLCFI